MFGRSFCLAATALLAVPMLATAQDVPSSQIDQVCRSELSSLCADGGGKRGSGMRCLIDNQSKLGADCGVAVKAAQERRAALQAACKSDADKLCGTESTGKRGLQMGCLRGKVAELSKSCADAIAALPPPAAKR